MIDFYMPVTPVPTPIPYYTSEASAGNNDAQRSPYAGATQFLAKTDVMQGPWDSSPTPKIPAVKKLGDSTPLLAETSDQAIRGAPAPRFSQDRETEVAKITESRIRILAEKYANDAISAELMARLEILNSRLTRHAPRVTEQQIGFLESSMTAIKSVENSRLERAKRLGLKI